MDLSWCIICDNRIMDDELSMTNGSESLYCSTECRLKDQENHVSPNNASPNNNKKLFSTSPLNKYQFDFNIFNDIKNTSSGNQLKPWMTKKSAKHHLYKSNTSSNTSYPWIPLYRKRHNYIFQTTKRCQPTVAGSPINATGTLLSIH